MRPQVFYLGPRVFQGERFGLLVFERGAGVLCVYAHFVMSEHGEVVRLVVN